MPRSRGHRRRILPRARALAVAGPIREWKGTAALRGISELADDRPDAVVLVANFGAPASVAALRRIRSDLPAARLVVVARDDRSAGAARQALNAGAEAFVRADDADQAIAPALDAVMAGLVCAPRAARRLIAKPTFSHREKEVLELLVAGLTNRQIAAQLYLAESTVKSHLASASRSSACGPARMPSPCCSTRPKGLRLPRCPRAVSGNPRGPTPLIDRETCLSATSDHAHLVGRTRGEIPGAAVHGCTQRFSEQGVRALSEQGVRVETSGQSRVTRAVQS